MLINSGKARYDEELEVLLKKYKIRFIYEPMNCTGDYECYGYYMDSVIVRKYGRGFTSRLKRSADSLFVAQWPRKTYWLWDVDQEPTCAVPDLNDYVTTHLKRPPGWDASPKNGPSFSSEREFVTAEFIVDTTGALSAIALQKEPQNLKASNRRHRPYLQQEIRRLLQTIGPWQPGQLAGHKVRCRYYVDVTLNPELN